MSKSFSIAGAKIDALANQLKGLAGVQALQSVIVETTELTQEEIVDKISGDVRPHSPTRRGIKYNNVTDLVDTAAYKNSWVRSYGFLEGKVTTNVPYAPYLEYGTENMAGFYVARDTARKMKKEFIDRLQEQIRASIR